MQYRRIILPLHCALSATELGDAATRRHWQRSVGGQRLYDPSWPYPVLTCMTPGGECCAREVVVMSERAERAERSAAYALQRVRVPEEVWER
eukprot:2296447-Rhodomonas_salina.1